MKNINKLLSRTILIISLAIATKILLIGSSVNNKSSSEVAEVKKGININSDPVGTIQNVLELGQDSSVIPENIDTSTKTKVQPISFRELITFLPPSPRGWTPEAAKGQTSSFGDYTISQVKQSYSQKDKTMTVSIFDWAFNSALYLPFLFTTKFSQESTEGYNKGIQINDIPGRENYAYQTKDGSLNLLINQRFLVQIDGDNIEQNELRQWWNLLDYQSLAKANRH
jgi:hypothetical protein